MKGIVLAGGTGTRLRPLTYTMPKQMIPVGGTPVLEYAINDMRDVGITEIGVVLGEHGRKKIKEYFGDGSDFGVNITYIYQGEPLGLGHAVGCTEDFVGDEPFVLYLGDDLLQNGIEEFVSQFEKNDYAGAIAVKLVDDPSRYGIVKTDNSGDIVGIIEKPDDPPSDFAGIGVFIFTPAVFDEIQNVEPSWRGEIELTDAIQGLLSQEEQFQSYIVDGWWYDVGTPEDVIAANRSVLDGLSPIVCKSDDPGDNIIGRARVGSGTNVHPGATVRGPVHLGDHVEIREGSYVGPYTTVADGCIIDGAAIESSVVIGNAEISCNNRIVDSIIGRTASLIDRDKHPEGVQLIVGADSVVQL